MLEITGRVTFVGAVALNVAVTAVSALKVSWQETVPEQPPDQP